MEWVLSILAAASMAAMALVNEYFKLPAIKILFPMRALAFLSFLPFTYWVSPPSSNMFYIYMFLSAIVFGISDLVRIEVTSRKNAGAVTRLDPLDVAITFVVWCIITPALLSSYLENLTASLFIVASLAGCIYFALRMKESKFSWEALKMMAPSLLLSSTGIILGALAMKEAPLEQALVYYILVQCFFVMIVYLGISSFSSRLPWKSIPDVKGMILGIQDKKVFWAFSLFSLAWLLHMPSKWAAISMVENPAYVTLVGLTAPLWVLGFYRIVGRKDPGDVRSGLGIVGCAFLLIIATRLM